MDVSDLRKRIVRALDDARKEAAVRRQGVDRASADFERFLSSIAVPLFRQAAVVLKAEGHPFTVETPTGSVRLSSDHSSETFLELELDGSGVVPQVIGRTSIDRGRRGVVVDEKPVSPGTPIAQLGDEDVSKLLVAEVHRLVARR
jgi:hypothetical protein